MQKKKLPAEVLGVLIPAALCIAVLMGLVIYAILSEAFYPGRRWVEPPVTQGEVNVEQEAAFGEKIDLDGVSFHCQGFGRVAGAVDDAGAAVYAFRVSWENETGAEVTLSPHALSVDTGYRSYGPIALEGDWLYGEYALQPGESLEGWMCLPLPESSLNTTLWIDRFYYTLRVDGQTVQTAPGEVPAYVAAPVEQPDNPEEVIPEH